MLLAGNTTSRGTGVAVLIGEGVYANEFGRRSSRRTKANRVIQRRSGSRQSILTYDIRQYMSYKIVIYALMKHINNDSQINVPASLSLNPSSAGMSTPQRLTPDRLPDPWLLDTESLLSELGRVRGLALQIPPARNDILGPINSVIDALWDLEERLRYCLHLHCEAQRDFGKKDGNNLPTNQIPKQRRHPAPRTASVRRCNSI
jgi:hypothetical protein